MSPARGAARSGYVIMGVSGCGKSLIGRALAGHLGLNFLDGDDLHPQANIAKMARGEPLDDGDRLPWLTELARRLAPGRIIACSALKRSYRDLIRSEAPGPVVLLYLRGQKETLAARMQAREGHFMPMALLDSQLAALEEPAPSERAMVADIEAAPDVIVAQLIRQINDGGGSPSAHLPDPARPSGRA